MPSYSPVWSDVLSQLIILDFPLCALWSAVLYTQLCTKSGGVSLYLCLYDSAFMWRQPEFDVRVDGAGDLIVLKVASLNHADDQLRHFSVTERELCNFSVTERELCNFSVTERNVLRTHRRENTSYLEHQNTIMSVHNNSNISEANNTTISCSTYAGLIRQNKFY